MPTIDQTKIRNFCIIAHIDHGKSTLADRIIEMTGLLTSREMQSQVLDNMELERERGITIKAQTVRIVYKARNGEEYIFNLIDTPGHVDFSYEVSRSIAACEGALLIVDASQGVQAQTISNLYMAIEHDLEIIPIINKCDMASAMPEEVEDEIVELLGCKRDEIIRASGKTGMGVEEILAAVIERIPHPEGDEEAPLQALIFDSVFNSFRGIIAYFKIENGVIRKGDKVMQIKNNYQIAWEVRTKYGVAVDQGMGVFNGDMGCITEVDLYGGTLEVEYDEHRKVTYPFESTDELELAYAITVHKSQGSEYPAVILPLLPGPRLLYNRNLLYTAVTRAKKCLTIVGSESVFQEMIRNKSEQNRYTSLAERIQEF